MDGTIKRMISSKRITTMQEAVTLLNCRRLPARLNTSEAAVVLGFHEHDIAVLTAAKLLTPLGKPAQNAPKYFAATDITACMENTDWLSRATRAITNHWLKKNDAKSVS